MTNSGGVGRSAAHLLFAVFAIYSFFISLQPLGDPDLWFHLKTGQLTSETRQLPSEVDPFSFTTPRPIPPGMLKGLRTQWLGQVVLYQLFDALGPMGFSILRSLALVSPFVIFYIAALRRGASPLAVAALAGAPLLVMSLVLYGTFERPQVFSFLLAPLVYSLAMRMRRTAGYWLSVALVVIMALWANLHGGYIIGVALLGAVAMGSALAMISDRLGFYLIEGPPRRPVLFFLVVVAAMAVTLINPAGSLVQDWAAGLVRGLLTHPGGGALRSGEVMGNVREYMPVWSFYGEPFHQWLYAATACYVLSLAALALKYAVKMRVDLSEALAAIMMMAFGLAYMRGISFALIFTGLFASISLPALMGRRLLAVAISGGLIIVLMTGHLASTRPWRLDPRPTGGWISGEFPDPPLAFLDEKDVKGRMFNLMSWGGYIIWRSYPRRQVFFDGREINAAMVSEYTRVMEARPGWRGILDAYNVDIILIPVLSSGNGLVSPIIFRMATGGPDPWRLVYLRGNYAVFVREATGTMKAIECCEIPFERVYGQMVDLARLMLLSSPGHAETMISEAFGLYWSGRYAEALDVLSGVPDSTVSLKLRQHAIKALQQEAAGR